MRQSSNFAPSRHRGGFVDQARRIGRERIAIESHQREGIGHIVDRSVDDRIGAFADETGVGAEHEYDCS
jgi:hypothetical protein